MQQVLGEFIGALRLAEVPVSTAETLDAMAAVRLIGLNQREPLKTALGMMLAKTQAHKQRYDILFERYFGALATDERSVASVEGERDDTPSSSQAGSSTSSGEAGAMVQSPLGQQLLSGDGAGIATAIAAAGREEGVNQIQVFTQKARFSYRIQQRLGMEALNRDLAGLNAADDLEARNLAAGLELQRQQLMEQVRDYVEQQYLLFAEEKGQRLLESNLQQIKLTHIDQHHYRRMTHLVRKAARLLASQHGRRRRVSKRGLLDVRKTIAANAAFDGVQFRTRWRSTRIDRPKVMVICDVSGSVSRVARFLLLFLYSLQDVMPRVRSFVFSGNLGEVTQSFGAQGLDTALAEVMTSWANMPTSYARALADFERLALADIDNKTTVIMLGDARNNNAPGNEKVWQEVYRRSQRVLWLNPENRVSWNTGDSIMAAYAPYCSQVEPCNTLRDLTRILGGLLKHG